MKLQANGIALEVEDSGFPGDPQPAVLLIMGLGMQLIDWPSSWGQALIDAGFRVIRFDNRDVGLSQKFAHLGMPNMLWEGFRHRMGLGVNAPYTLHDMADDALGVLDALGVARAHVVGASMGGMIAQRVALTAPERVLSLTSIMSSSSARYLPGPRPEVLHALLSRPEGHSEEAIVDHSMRLWRIIGSPGFPMDESALREQVTAGIRRSYNPTGTLRQMAATVGDTRRPDELPRIKTPTLVMHGKDDPLVPLACGQDTARRIGRSRFVAFEGMGHDLAPGVVDMLLKDLIPHLRRAAP